MLAAILAATRRHRVQLGVRDQTLRKEVVQSLQQASRAMKEVKVLGCEQYYLEPSRVKRTLAKRRAFLHYLIGTPHC